MVTSLKGAVLPAAFAACGLLPGLIVVSLIPQAHAQSTGRRAQSATLHRPGDGGYLGVGVIDLTDDRVKALGLKDNHGVEITDVRRPSAADRAGLQESDVILEVNGKTVLDGEQFIHTISESNAGARINLTVWRDGAKQKLTATLEARPDSPMSAMPATPAMPAMPVVPPDFPLIFPATPALVGFEGESLSPQLADFFGVKEGVLVRTVNPGTPAARAGLKAGDVVIKVNGTPVTSPREITGLVRSSRDRHLSFTVVRNRKEIRLDIEVAEFEAPYALIQPF